MTPETKGRIPQIRPVNDGASLWWLNRARDHVVKLTLHDGTEVIGKLLRHDTYTLILETGSQTHPVMISKSAIASYVADSFTTDEEYVAQIRERRAAKAATA